MYIKRWTRKIIRINQNLSWRLSFQAVSFFAASILNYLPNETGIIISSEDIFTVVTFCAILRPTVTWSIENYSFTFQKAKSGKLAPSEDYSQSANKAAGKSDVCTIFKNISLISCQSRNLFLQCSSEQNCISYIDFDVYKTFILLL